MTEDDDPIDSNTCHMTRIFDSPAALAFIDSLRKKHQKAVPLVWRIRQTKCMEEISLINEAARQEVMKTMATEDRINLRNIAKWRQEMGGLKSRHSKWITETEISTVCSSTTISRSGRVRYDANWTDDEKRQCIRCFHWHQDDFESISNVILTKTVDQIKAFYKEHEEILSKSLQSYREVMKSRRMRIDGNIRY
ncbi:hypothetical protein CRE_24888 [Caenorhabditis remanei]|nr:hypothetical protein CRE_24888 [Caenorhabditis remanei]